MDVVADLWVEKLKSTMASICFLHNPSKSSIEDSLIQRKSIKKKGSKTKLSLVDQVVFVVIFIKLPIHLASCNLKNRKCWNMTFMCAPVLKEIIFGVCGVSSKNFHSKIQTGEEHISGCWLRKPTRIDC